MKRFLGLATMVLFASGLLVSCGGGGDSSTTSSIMVNAATGSDTTGNGVTIPYKTITKALSMASYGDTVTVGPGTYDNILGETFPIFIPAGVALIGDEVNKGNGPDPTLIRGGGTIAGYDPTYAGAAVHPGDNTAISGFTIHNDNTYASFSFAVMMNHDGIVVKNSRIVDYHHVAIYVRGGGADSVISGNVIQNNNLGIAFVDGSGGGTRIENNVITQNGTGVEYDSPTTSGDLGGGPTGSVGGNVIAGNMGDLWTNISSTSTIYAANNYWDHVPPASEDIYNMNGATIVTTGALLAP